MVGFINDDDRCFALFKGKTGDFLLNNPEIIGFPVGRRSPEFGRQMAIEVIGGQGGKTGVDDLE